MNCPVCGKEMEKGHIITKNSIGLFFMPVEKDLRTFYTKRNIEADGGIVLDGRLYRGVNFAEGEIGHMTIRYDGIDCNCGRKGCFEAYASASALVRRAAQAAQEHPESRLNALTGGDAVRMNGRIFFQAVREKDGGR